MAAVEIDPDAAVIVHALTGVDEQALNMMQAEDFLLVHQVRVAGTREVFREVNSSGACFLRVDYDPVLRWSVSAEVLGHYKLANWHPGRSLSLDELEFFNGEFVPFGYKETTRTMIYENPVIEMEGGDMTGITFNVVDEFTDYDIDKLAWPDPSTVLHGSRPGLVPSSPGGGPGGGGGGYWG